MSVEATEEGLDTTTDEESVTDPTEALDETEIQAEPTEEVAAESDETTGQPRDDKGRFAPKATEQAEEATQVPLVAEPAAVVGEPFSVRAGKQDYPIEGALFVKGEGLKVPEDQLPAVSQLLSEGIYYRTNWRRLEQGYKEQIESLKSNPQKSENEERASAILKELDQILTDPEKLIEFAARLEVEGPALKERARANWAEQRLKEYESRSQSEKKQKDDEQLSELKDQAWTETFQTLKGEKQFQAFTPEDWKTFEEEMSEIRDSLFEVHDGQTFLNEGKIQKFAQRRGQILSRVGNTAKEVEKAVTFNAQRKTNTAQPNVQRKTVESPKDEPPKDWKEWNRRNGLPY